MPANCAFSIQMIINYSPSITIIKRLYESICIFVKYSAIRFI